MGKIRFVVLEIAILFCFVIIISGHTFAQMDSLKEGGNFKITLKNDFEMKGIIKNITIDTVKIETSYKLFNVPRTDIASIIDLDKIVIDTTSKFADPNDSRLFLGPSGKTLKQGSFYISCASFFPWIWIPFFFPFGSAGITDYINLGVGASPYPPLFYIAPKFRAVHLENVNVSLGFAYAQSHEFQDVTNPYNIGFIYGVSTFDFEKYYSVSVGTGLFYNIDWSHKSNIYITGFPHLMLGFEAQTTKDFKMISENWIDLGSGNGASFSVFSLGGRIIGEHTAFDFTMLGILTNSTLEGHGGKSYLIPIPWVSFAYNFSIKDF